LLIIARSRESSEPEGQMPWPLTCAELSAFTAAGLKQISFEDLLDSEDPGEPAVRRFHALSRFTTLLFFFLVSGAHLVWFHSRLSRPKLCSFPLTGSVSYPSAPQIAKKMLFSGNQLPIPQISKRRRRPCFKSS